MIEKLYDDGDAGKALRARAERVLLRKIIREMVLVIDANELAVLLFIFDRTYCYGHVEHAIPMNHFINGIFDRGDNLVRGGLKLTRSPINRAISGLIAKGIVFRQDGNVKKAPVYAINHEWELDKYRVGYQSIPHTVSMNTAGGINNNIESNKKDINSARAHAHPRGLKSVNYISPKDSQPMTDPMEAVRAAVAAATAKNTHGKERKKAKNNATAFETIWRDAFVETFPTETCFKWKMMELAAFKRALERGVPIDHAKAFTSFCVSSHANVLRTQLSWMKSAPPTPTPTFVVKHIEKYWQAYQDSINPNRKLDAVIASSPKRVDNVISNADKSELEQLRIENAALKSERTFRIQSKAVNRKKTAARLIAARPRSVDGFEPFRDD